MSFLSPTVAKETAKIDPGLFWVWDEKAERWDLWHNGGRFLLSRPPRTLGEVWGEMDAGAIYHHKLRWETADGGFLPLTLDMVSLVREIHNYSCHMEWKLRESIETARREKKEGRARELEGWAKDRADYWKPYLNKVLMETFDPEHYSKYPTPMGQA